MGLACSDSEELELKSPGTLLSNTSYRRRIEMLTNIEKLEAEALCLPADQRAHLVEKLIASLDCEPDIEAAWANEVELRHAEVEAGTVKMLPGAETLTRLSAEFQ